MKLNHYRMIEAFASNNTDEIARTLADEFDNRAIAGLRIISQKKIYSKTEYVECCIGNRVHEWYPDDGFTTRSREPEDLYKTDHIFVVLSDP